MKMYRKILITAAFSSLSFTVLSQEASVISGPGTDTDIISQNAKGYYSQVFGYPINSITCQGLYETITNWLGTPYVYSGKSENGIDCSGFVTMLYNKVYNIPLCGNSSDLYQKVILIKRKDLHEGDLVFFRIHKRKISHVGIYIGSNKFAHASRTNGVIISDLDEPYYKKYFVKGGKVKGAF
jgi:lipoprotein Spr